MVGYSNATLSISESYATGKIKGSNLSSNSGVGGFLGRSQANGATITNSYSLVDVSNRTGDTTVATNDDGGIGIFIGTVFTTSSSSITKSYGASHADNTRFVNGGNAGTQTQTYSNIARGSATFFDGVGAASNNGGRPAGLNTALWARVDQNYPYLVNNEDKYLKRTKVYIPAPTAFKYTKKADGAGVDTMALALGITAKTGLSGYDIKADTSLFNITSGVSEYDAGKKVTFVITDTAGAQPPLNTTETIATTVVEGSTEQRAGLSELGIIVAAYDQTVMSAYDTITLIGSYYGAPILTGAAGSTAATLPIGIDAKGIYAENDLAYVDELETIFGAGKTYTIRNDILMSNTVYKTVIGSNNTAVAGSQFAGTLDGGGKTIKNLRLVGQAGDKRMGIFARLGNGAVVKNLSITLGANITVSTASYKGVGIIAGDTSTAGTMTISNVHVDFNGKSVALNQKNFFGGIVGDARTGATVNISKSSVIDIANTVSDSTDRYMGGLVGSTNAAINISESFVTGKLTGGYGIGGIVGMVIENSNVSITNSYAAVEITTTATYPNTTGVLIGQKRGGALSISKSWGTSSNADTPLVGGVISGSAVTFATDIYSNKNRFRLKNTGTRTAVYDGLSATAGTAGLPTGLGNTIWARVDQNYPYLVNTEDAYLKRTKVYIPAPTAFKYTKKADGAGADTMALALGIGAKAGLSGYDIIEDVSLFNITSGVSEYDAGKNVTFVISDTAGAQAPLFTTETIATTVVEGSSEQRTGLSNLGVIVAGYNQTAVNAYDTVTLIGSYYGAPILTGAAGTAAATLPIGIDVFSLYTGKDLTYVDELETALGGGQTYTIRKDIVMSNTVYKTVVGPNTAAGEFKGTLDGGGKKITNLRLFGETGDKRMGIFARLGNGAVVKNLSVELGANINIVTNSYRGTGIIAGEAAGTGTVTISNVHVDFNGKSVALNNINFFGGLVGLGRDSTTFNISKSSVVDFANTTSNNTNKFLGGLVGNASGSSILNISESFVTGAVRGSFGAGGLVGITESTGQLLIAITNSYAVVELTNTNTATWPSAVGIFNGVTIKEQAA